MNTDKLEVKNEFEETIRFNLVAIIQLIYFINIRQDTFFISKF